MDIENLIKETFNAREHDAPDGDAVLAAARRRIDRPRAVLSRPLAVAAGVAVLTLGAVTVMALNRPGPAPTDEAQAAAPVHKAPAKPGIANLSMPFSLGWLPPGPVDYLARRINTVAASGDPQATPVYGGEYLLTVTADGQVLDVDVQQMSSLPIDQAMFKSGPGRPVTVNGQRGVESARSGGPGGYELYLAHRDGGTMYVNVAAEPGSTAPAQRLVDFGRRVAQHIRFPGTATVTPAFGLRDLPSGLRTCAFEAGHGTTHYSLGTCTTTMAAIEVGTHDTNQPAGTPGHPVQGHATRHLDENGYTTLWVLDAVKAGPIAIAGRVSLTELYDVANSLVLPTR